MKMKLLPDDHPLNGVTATLLKRMCEAQSERLEDNFPSAAALLSYVADSERVSLKPPQEMAQESVRSLSDRKYKDLVNFYEAQLIGQGASSTSSDIVAAALAERTQLVAAFADPEAAVRSVEAKVRAKVSNFPRTLTDIEVGSNPGDVLDPYILAANQELLFGGELDGAVEATVTHKALMKIEDLLGHLHEDVVGQMRGNVRVPEPRGEDQETLDPTANPFPGADVMRPPLVQGDVPSFHQIKSKTGSAKGGDGARLGKQLLELTHFYGGEAYYHALVGNTLRGHRSRTAVEKNAPGVVVLVGTASFEVLVGSRMGPQFLLRLYQSAFRKCAEEEGYRADRAAACILQQFRERAEAHGDGLLETIVDDVTTGPPEELDNRLAPKGRRRGR